MRYEIETISSYDGRGGKTKAIIAYAVTGECVSVCRSRPFENKTAWMARAVDDAERRVAEMVTVEIVA